MSGNLHWSTAGVLLSDSWREYSFSPGLPDGTRWQARAVVIAPEGLRRNASLTEDAAKAVRDSAEERDAVLMRAGAQKALNAFCKRLDHIESTRGPYSVPAWIYATVQDVLDSAGRAEKCSDFEDL